MEEEEKKLTKNQIIVIFVVLLAFAGMWFCYRIAWVRGAETICENSGGLPVMINTGDIKKSQCLIEYDPLSIHKNNLGLDAEEVNTFKEGLKNG